MKKKIYRNLSAGVALICLGSLIYQYFRATDFPRKDPIKRVDQKLVDHLRKNPGLHMALAKTYKLEIPLNLKADKLNGILFGSEKELRETRAYCSIHIQILSDRGAIHTDRYNPTYNLWYWILHNSLDVPTLPLLVIFFASLVVFLFCNRSPLSHLSLRTAEVRTEKVEEDEEFDRNRMIYTLRIKFRRPTKRFDVLSPFGTCLRQNP